MNLPNQRADFPNEARYCILVLELKIFFLKQIQNVFDNYTIQTHAVSLANPSTILAWQPIEGRTFIKHKVINILRTIKIVYKNKLAPIPPGMSMESDITIIFFNIPHAKTYLLLQFCKFTTSKASWKVVVTIMEIE